MRLRRTVTALAVLTLFSTGLNAQTPGEFKAECDSLQILLQERTSVRGSFKASKVKKNGDDLSFWFTQSLGDYPWREADVKWFTRSLKELLPDKYRSCGIGSVYAGKNLLVENAMPVIGNDGRPGTAKFRTKDHRPHHPFIEEVGSDKYHKGLTGRNIALWQSHGRYYEEKLQRWEWQRAPVFQTVEDLYTQSYVLPFLIPMLENAGAYVMTPRERDIQTNEVIADNDPSFTEGRMEGVRTEGEYSETGNWSDAGTGFADAKAAYSLKENPFLTGTARKADCKERNNERKAEARWTPDIPSRGDYAVYVSYKTLPNSTSCALYSVKHLGGTTEFIVNQKMGGGTWIYLGTFEFEKGTEGYVSLDNEVPEGRNVDDNAVVTADAVRFGGGMGKIARGSKDAPANELATSGMPSFTEGAYYWMQWAGTDSTVLNLHEDDYTSDYADRGAWVNWMAGGSRTNPKVKGENIPVDLSFAFHTDAGTTPNDSIVGTLSIYTLLSEGKRELPDGEDRLEQRLYADYVQTQIVEDIRKEFNQDWNRRGLWDKSYSESRTPCAPAMLLELLSHQNFEDMKYGLDPSFRFAVSRAVYKGMLKFLSSRYGHDYAVQPLPVNSFATSFLGDSFNGSPIEIRLDWKATADTLEPTADPDGYIIYTRIDDGAFDNGKVLRDLKAYGDGSCVTLPIVPGHIYSYRIVAFNEGGKSFPSETLSVGVPESVKGKSVLVVNNFTRVGAPAWFDTPDYAGFNNGLDAGVGYIREINFIGDQYQFRRELPWMDDDNPGFGGSFTDQAGKIVPGNTFDFTMIHGKALMSSGHPFHSSSNSAFEFDCSLSDNDFAIDLICGKQVTTMTGGGERQFKHQVFPLEMRTTIKRFTDRGGHILISGADIGADVWDKIYPLQKDSTQVAESKEFIEKTLGYKWMTNYATKSGTVRPMRNGMFDLAGRVGRMEFHQERNPVIYNVETPDGIVPANDKARTFLRYTDTNISAATCFDSGNHRTVCLGFPIEVLKAQRDIDGLMASIMDYFENK